MDQHQATSSARDYYNAKQSDRNLRLGAASGYVNHHFGIGPGDPAGGEPELHRLEMAQTEALLDRMAPVAPGARVLDAGSGRGGTAFRIAHRFGATVVGVNVSDYQVAFANALVARHRVVGRVRFEVRSYYELTEPPGSYTHVVTNETTFYARDLGALFHGFARVLVKGGRYTLATWCLNEERPASRARADEIAAHYVGRMHRRADYLAALRDAGFRDVRVDDATADAIPYWQMRRFWSQRSGIEDAFIEGHLDRTILYLFVTATT